MRHIDRKEAWWALVFLTVGTVSFGSFYLFADKVASERSPYRRIERLSAGDVTPQPTDPANEKNLRLPLNLPVSVGHGQLVYKGPADGGRIRIDVIIPALDPEVPYPYVLSKKEAKRGFRLVQENWRLESAGEKEVSLRRVP